MNRRFLVLGLLVALVCLPAISFGQWSDDFDSYALGQLTPQSTWEGWGGPDDPAVVSDAQALSGSNSVAVSGGSDLVHTYSGYTSGKWTYHGVAVHSLNFDRNPVLHPCSTRIVPGSEAWSVQLPFDLDTGLMNDDYAAGVESSNR